MMHIISLGAGVQSSTMALMAARGEITPMPDCAIFADTGAEPQEVYDWLDWLEKQLPFPVHRVMWKEGLTRNIEDSLAGGRFASMPAFTESATSAGGMLRRQCTREFKIQPITQKVRELVGLKKGKHAPRNEVLVSQWIGISRDEIQRMKDMREKWIDGRWPLLELKMTRWHCLEWMQKNGYMEPPRSACVYCPYHSNAEWQHLKNNYPEAWEEAQRIDALIRDGVPGTKEKLYLHRDMKPLAECNLTTPESAGQISWLDECEGMCGM